MAEFFPVERYQKWAGKSASYIDHTNRETMHLHVWIPILSTNLIDRLCFGQVKHSVWQENLVWRFMVMGGLNHIWWHNCVYGKEWVMETPLMWPVFATSVFIVNKTAINWLGFISDTNHAFCTPSHYMTSAYLTSYFGFNFDFFPIY